MFESLEKKEGNEEEEEEEDSPDKELLGDANIAKGPSKFFNSEKLNAFLVEFSDIARRLLNPPKEDPLLENGEIGECENKRP